MCGKKKGNRHHTTLGLLNAEAEALCLRPDPELVKVFGTPRRRRSVESFLNVLLASVLLTASPHAVPWSFLAAGAAENT